MSKVNIKVFAALKDHLDEDFTIFKSMTSIIDLKKEICNMNPAIQNLLENCRFAVDNRFIDNTFKLKENDTIYIMPPSSGG